MTGLERRLRQQEAVVELGQRALAAESGVGRGLAIVRDLVALHGGTVSVESTGEGQGATFTVLLPAP